MGAFDDLIPRSNATGGAFDDLIPTARPKRKRGVGDVVEDLAKGFGGAAVSAVGAVPTAVGRAIQEGGETMFGLSMDEAKRLAEAEGTPEKALEWYEKANRLNPVSAAGRAIESGGRWISEKGGRLRDARSDEAKELARQSTPDGDLTKPSTWTMGENPTVEGVAQVAADVIGSMAPPVATAIATRGRSATTQMRAGGATVAGQIGGSAMDEAGEYLGQFSDEQLRQVSPVFRELESKGYSASDARTILERDAENRAATFAAPVGYAGGQATAAILGKPGEKLAGKLGSIPAKMGVLGALGATEEGLQEVAEGIATRAGINDATGTDRSLTEGTFGEFVLGAKGGGVTGAGKGLIEGVQSRGQRAASGSITNDGTTPNAETPAITPETGNAPTAPTAPEVSATTSQSADPSARLAELEILAEQRDLTPVERQEAVDLLTALNNEQDAPQGTDDALTNEGDINEATPVEAPTAEGGDGAAVDGVPAEPAAPELEAAGVEVSQPAQPVTPGQAEPQQPTQVAPPADFWSFAKSQGYTPGQVQIGSTLHAALKAEYDAIKAGNAEPILPSMQPQQDVNLQNRDRGRAASVVQMSDIARNPDYMRLGPSRTPDSGAPMVFAVGDQINIEPQAMGRQDVAVMSDGQRVPFRYAVVDASTVNPSNFADGRQNPEFNSTTPGTLKALNNGRTAGVRAAHELGAAGEYVSGLRADEAMHGIPADVIARTPNPMLVRVYSDSDNTAGMAAKSQGQGLDMSPEEYARQDAPLYDTSVLGVYAGGDVNTADNRDFVRAVIGKLQDAGQPVGGMMTATGELSPTGLRRIQAGLMQAAYGDADLVAEMFGSIDTDIKAIGEALKAVAGQWANMRDSAKLGAINPQADITQNLLQAIGLIRKARRDKTMVFDLVNQPDLMTGEAPDATTVGVLRMFYNGQYMTRAVGKDKLTQNLSDYVRRAMVTSADAGLFGETVTPGQILETIELTEGQSDAETQPQEGSGQPAGRDTAGIGASEGEQGVGRQVAGEGGAGPDTDSRSEPAQDADTGAQQQVGPGDQRTEEGDGAAAASAGTGQQEGADGQVAATGTRGRARKAKREAVKPKRPADGKSRAVSGGQDGINGYFYKGGQFLPNTQAEPGKWKVKGKWVQSSRALVAPGEFAFQPTPFSRSLFELASVGASTVLRDGKLEINPGAEGRGVRAADGTPVTRDMEIRPGVKGVLGKESLTMGEIIDAWNNGQRWFDVQPDAETITTQQSKPAAKKAAKPGTPEPRGMTYEGRATDGKPINPGDTFLTSSGRVTTGYPKQQAQKYASQWLINNAVLEAEARGDSFNLRAFQNTKPLKSGSLTDADRDSMLEYLFGQQPAVVPSILKPLTGQPAAEDDYLNVLFTPGQSQETAAQPADLSGLVPALRAFSEKKLAEANDWASRQYKDNRTKINLQGDGPTRNETISISAANESRRRRNVEALKQQAQDASNLANRIERGRDVSAEIARAISNAEQNLGPAIGKTLQDRMEGYISNALLGDENYAYGEGSLARLILDTYQGKNAPAEPLLTNPTAEEVVARQDAAEAAQREKEAAERKTNEDERKRQEREEIRRRSEAAADTFELGQNAMDNLSGQGTMFSRSKADPLSKAINEMIAAEKALEQVRAGDPNKVTLDRWMALSERSLAAKKALTVELAKIPDEGFALQAGASNGRMVMLTPSAQQKGKWQLTRFDQKGEPWGDTNYPTKEQAIRDFIEEADLNSLSGAEGPMFSRAKADEARDLVITHNLTAENLLHAVKMGGIAVPSLAVTKKDSSLTNFGEITLIGDKTMADPKGYASTKVFGADIYSPRYPSVERDLDNKAVAALTKKFRPMADRMGASLPGTSELQREGQREMERNPAVMGQFLQDKGIEPAMVFRTAMSPEREARLTQFGLGPFLDNTDAFALRDDPVFFKAALAELIDAYGAIEGKRAAFVQQLKTNEDAQRNMVRDTAHEIANAAKQRKRPEIDRYASQTAMEKQIADAGLANDYQQYVLAELDAITKSERIFQGFTYSGNRKYIPHTLENVVKLLKKELRGGENFNYGVGSLRAKFTPQFKSVAEIRKNKDRLITAEQFEDVKKEIDAEFIRVANAINPDLSLDTASAILEDAAKKGVRASAKAYGYDISGEAATRAAEFLTRLRTLPTAYFEAKILRDVSLSEFRAAVVPEGVNPKALQALRDAGVQTIRTYPKGDNDARAKAVQEVADSAADDVLFSKGRPGAMPESTVRQVADTIAARWTQAPTIVVVQNMQDMRVPQSAREEDARQREGGATGVPRGFYHRGTVYLVADGLKSVSDAAEALFHEALGHYGLRAVFGSDLDGILDQIAMARPDLMKRKAEEYGKDLSVLKQRREVAEEVLAEMAQTKPELGFVKRAIAAIRTWLRKNVPALKDMNLSDAEILNNYILPARGWVERGQVAMQPGGKVALLRAFHGTPHRGIDKFSTDFIGTGEGNQSFGWGLYFSGLKEIGEYYRKALAGASQPRFKKDGKTIETDVEIAEAYFAPGSIVNGYGGRDKVITFNRTGESWSVTVQRVDSEGNASPYERKRTHSTFPEAKPLTAALKAQGWNRLEDGQLYEVEIPDDTDMLLWDKPMSEQPAKVRAALNLSRLQESAFRNDGTPRNISGQDLYEQLVAENDDNAQAASEYLASLGIKGIKFPAEQFAGAKEIRGHNYVIFSGDDVNIQQTFFSRSTLGNTPPTPPQNPNAWQKLKAKALELVSPEAITNLIYELQDKNIDLKNLRDHIKELGGTITDLNDAYLGEELYHKRVAKRTQDFLSEELKPLLADLRARGLDLPTLERFLHARHAPEANRVLAERNPNAQMIADGKAKAAKDVKALEVQLQRAKAQGTATKALDQALELAREELSRWTGVQAFKGTEAERLSLSGMSDKEAADAIANLKPGQKVHLDALAAKVDAMNAKTLETLEKYGLMDKSSLDAWRNTYQHYVPLHRDEAHPDAVSHPIGQGFSTKGDAGKRRTGSNEKVTNIMAHIAMQREAALTRGEKNRVAKKLYLMAAQNPDPEVWTVDRPPMSKTVDRETGFVRTGVDPTYKNKPNVVMMRIGGKDHAIVFNERNPQAVRLAQSIKGADLGDLNAFDSTMGKATRWLASVNTQWNPIFGIINFARDVQAAILQLSTTPLAGQERAVAANVPAALKGIYAEVRGRRKGQARGTGDWAKLWEEMQDEGGTTGYRELFIQPDERVKALEKELKALDRGQASEAAHAVVDWLSDYNETMENAVRLSAYKVALDQGMSKERAASLAKNITVNFNRKGRQTAKLGAYYAFLNAAIQGTTRMVETLRGPMGKKIMLGGVMLGAVNTLLAMTMMGAGEDDDNWEKIPDFVKERSIIIPLGREDFLAIPMPLGFHVLPNIGRKAVEMMLHNDPTVSAGKHVTEMLRLVLDSFNPLGGSTNMAQMVTPTPFDPAIALIQNRDWTGKPIYREDNSNLDPTPGHTRTKDTASTPSKWVSEALVKITGGTDYQPGAINWTPDQIDYVIGQITGGLGREVMKLEQAITSPFTGEELPPHKIPLAGRIYGNTRGPASESEKFYENLTKLNGVEREIRGRARDGEDYETYMAEEPLADLVGLGNSAENQISKLRQARREVVRQGLPGYQEEVKELNAQIGDVMKTVNQEVKRAKMAAQ
jgi:hypothetical protein